MSNQSLKQASVRAVTGTALTYEGDWHALFDSNAIPAGTFNSRLLQYINAKLSASYTNLPDAMTAFAVANSAPDWNGLGTFSASALPATVKVTSEGDSITNGFGQAGWPIQTVPARMPAGPTYTLNNIGTSGISADTININYASRAGASYDSSKALNILTLLAGTNDGAATNEIAVYRRLRSIIRKARITGYQRVAIGTLTSRNDGGGSPNADGNFNASTLPLNVDIRTYWNSDLDADAIMDFGGNALFDTAADADNATYYLDKLHPTTLAYDTMSLICSSALTPLVSGAGTRVTAPATFSPFDVSGFFTLSNSNRTVAWTSGGFNDASVRGFIGKSTGKWYWEQVADNASFIGFGVGNFNYSYDYQGNKNMTDSDGCIGMGWPRADGRLYYNSTEVTGAQPAISNGDVCEFAMDADAKLFWYRKAGQTWNGSGTANPATGVGGVDMTSLGVGPYYPLAYIRSSGGIITAKFALSQITGSAPSGFKALDQ